MMLYCLQKPSIIAYGSESYDIDKEKSRNGAPLSEVFFFFFFFFFFYLTEVLLDTFY